LVVVVPCSRVYRDWIRMATAAKVIDKYQIFCVAALEKP